MTTTAIAVPLKPVDRPYLRIALAMLKGAVKTAEKSAAVLDLDRQVLDQRKTDGEAIGALMSDGNADDEFWLPVKFARTCRIAVALEFDRLVKLQEDQLELLVPDDDIKVRIQHLNALLAVLDEQGSLFIAGREPRD